jgi:hypothetical protein
VKLGSSFDVSRLYNRTIRKKIEIVRLEVSRR